MKVVPAQALKRSLELWTRMRDVIRLAPHDTSTEHGRSRERYRRVALTTMASLVSRGIALLTTLVSVPLTFRYLGAERYGVWMVLVSFITVIGCFADLGLGNGVTNAIAEAHGKEDRDLAREYVSSCFVLMLGIATILLVAGIAAFPFVPWIRLLNVKTGLVASEGAKAFLVLFGWFVLNIPLGVVTRVQSGLQRGYWSSLIAAGGNIVSLLALLLVIQLRGSLPWLVFASSFGAVVATALNGWVLFRSHPWLIPSLRAYRGGSARKILNLGMMFVVLQGALAVGYTSDNIVITQVMGAAAVAVYAVPQKFFGSLTQLVYMGVSPLWPAYGEALARGDVAWIRRVFWRSTFVTLAISVPLCTALALAGRWIVNAVSGKSLHAPMSLLAAMAVYCVVVSLSSTMSIMLNGVGVLRAQAIIVSIASISNLALSIYLTRRYGVIGVCLGSIIAQVFISFPAYFVVIRKQLRSMESLQNESGRLQPEPDLA